MTVRPSHPQISSNRCFERVAVPAAIADIVRVLASNAAGGGLAWDTMVDIERKQDAKE